MLNKIQVIGHVGRDPELRYTKAGDPVCNFTLATNERWKDGSGEQQSRTEWHRVVVWGKQADIANRYLSKGRLVYIEGRIQARKYTDRDGVERTTVEIVARDLQFLDRRESEPRRTEDHNAGRVAPPPDDDAIDDEIPF